MKRIERKHLKENELAQRLEAVREFIEPRQQALKTIGLVAVALVVVALGFSLWQERSGADSERALADALVALNAEVVPTGVTAEEGLPAAATLGATGTFATEEAKLNAAVPKLKAVTDAFPNTDAGIQAQYHLAGALAALGRHDEAMAAFDVVVERAGADSLYGRMARLGRADAQARAGQLDAAIESWRGLQAEEGLPADAILMQIARAYVEQGNTEEARKALTEIVDNHPNSPYTPEARAELELLKG
jgi:tetratricopeptide (TPR) repeat protein